MLSFDHELARKLGTIIALIIATSTVVVRVALYADEVEDLKVLVDQHKFDHDRLSQRLIELESSYKSRVQMDKYQNKMIERHESAIYVPKSNKDN